MVPPWDLGSEGIWGLKGESRVLRECLQKDGDWGVRGSGGSGRPSPWLCGESVGDRAGLPEPQDRTASAAALQVVTRVHCSGWWFDSCQTEPLERKKFNFSLRSPHKKNHSPPIRRAKQFQTLTSSFLGDSRGPGGQTHRPVGNSRPFHEVLGLVSSSETKGRSPGLASPVPPTPARPRRAVREQAAWGAAGPLLFCDGMPRGC